LTFGCVLVIFGRFFSEKVPVQVHIKILTSQNASRALPAGSHAHITAQSKG
jgi:hypothetical protein